MKQVNGEVRLLIVLTMLFVFALPVGFLVITASVDEHDQDDILDTGGAVPEDEVEEGETGLEEPSGGNNGSTEGEDSGEVQMENGDSETVPNWAGGGQNSSQEESNSSESEGQDNIEVQN